MTSFRSTNVYDFPKAKHGSVIFQNKIKTKQNKHKTKQNKTKKKKHNKVGDMYLCL